MMTKVRRTIERHRLLRKGDRIIAAVSGGPDSVAMLRILKGLSEKGYGLTLTVAHLNHGLRGSESDREEQFVRELCASLAVPFHGRRADMAAAVRRGGGSLEEACRRERYAFFEELRIGERMDRVALGHHLDDQAETVLMRFLRGSGTEGLKAMAPLRDGVYIRPLIEVTRREILSYLAREGTAFMEDSSNERDIFLRNRIRRELLPFLIKEYNPRLVENLGRMTEIIRLEDDFIQGIAEGLLHRWREDDTDGTIRIPLEEWRPLHEALRRRLVKTILLGLSPRKQGIGYRHVDAVMKVVEGNNPGAVLDMPFRVRVGREYGRLFFEKKKEVPQGSTGGREKKRDGGKREKTGGVIANVPGTIHIPEWGKTLSFSYVEKSSAGGGTDRSVFVDPGRIYFPLEVRARLPGDRMEPLGMGGKTKKVQDIFVDEKISRHRRDKIPLVVDRESVIWIPGVRLSGRVAVTERTGRVLKIEIN